MDEALQMFVEEFGFAVHRRRVSGAAIERWSRRLPDRLLSYWREEGWCGYANGLFWTVDPDEYEDLADEWLEGTGLDEIDSFHVIARSAFGDLYLCGERTGCSATVSCELGQIFALAKDLAPKSEPQRDNSIASLFLSSKSDFDLLDSNGIPMFERAYERLGALLPDEIYGFEPALPLGGKLDIGGLKTVKLDQHLTILRQLSAPNLPLSKIDLAKLARN